MRKTKVVRRDILFRPHSPESRCAAHKLPLYLSHLQDIGLIKYSMKDKFIYLTALGHKTAAIQPLAPAATQAQSA
ncbi:MAG: hypothetical protein K0Q79_3204 [Flavipsychrobacter sp.]|jgi:hypothetical protein|nr:hypothetical protein [Flavipsychrobacter sp.]